MRRGLNKETASRMGRASVAARENARLARALNLGEEIRSEREIVLLEISTRNPQSGQRHEIACVWDSTQQSMRFRVVLDGDPSWRANWSKTRFARWLMRQIVAVSRRYWE